MNVNGVSGLFPLNKLVTYANCDGYYIDRKGDVFSTRNGPTPLKMAGSIQRGSSDRTFTLSLNGLSQTRWSKSLSAKGAKLLLLAKAHPDWEKETGASLPTTKEIKELKARTHAESTASGIKGRGFVIARLEGDALVFGSKPVVHMSKESVEAEVERLANKSPGKTIVYLQVVGSARAASLVWE